MIKIFKRLLEFSGAEKKNLILSFLFHMCNSFFEMLPIMAVLTVLSGILSSLSGNEMPYRVLWISFGILSADVQSSIPESMYMYPVSPDDRSEERRVGKECRSRWSPYH